ncbi:hypothetical protein [Halorubrum pallidum]|uniref:Uncharacterized protein n=1 Tax=Halorubrum pallidum TaxID=1526114 RepID=A0ABD5T3D1_9EURY
MHRRSVIAFVGSDTDVRDDVIRAIESAWDGSRVPEHRIVDTGDLAEESGDDPDSQLTDVCGIVASAGAVDDTVVAEKLASTPEDVPVIVVLGTTTVDAFRSALQAAPDDLITRTELGETRNADADSGLDPLARRLAETMSPRRVRFGVEDAERLRAVLLDAGPMLMSTRTDEVDTKITWTMANVGEHPESIVSSVTSVTARRSLRDTPGVLMTVSL